MPRGMNRTVIMSHGRMHDAAGVRGTHLKGTVPEGKVLDAIPTQIGAVGNLPDATRPGQSGVVMRDKGPVQVRTGKPRMDEGVPVIPGGAYDRGPATQRPQFDEDEPLPTRSSSGKPEPVQVPQEEPAKPAPATLLPPPDEEPEEPQDELQEEEQVPDLRETLSKRKLTRAKVEELREWCEQLDINPEEYVAEDEVVTGVLMRQLLAEALDIEL